jgi:hypothetical protein
MRADEPTAHSLLLVEDGLTAVKSLRDQAVTMLPRP